MANCFVVPDLTPPEVRESLMQSVKEQAMDEGVSDNCNVTEFEVANSSSRMKWKSSPTDFIPAVALKNLLPHILIPLSILFSCFFESCSLPVNFKKAVVVPLYKGKGSVTDPGNYRPISMLPNLSKLFEYVINTRLMLDVERKGLLIDNQHGFRAGRSCTTAHAAFTNDFYNSLDKRNTLVIACFIDIKQAFNNILHCLLIKDLVNIFKLNSRLVLLIFSFLSERQFIIKLGDYVSTTFFDNRGICQGTVNGPALFILFFNKVASVLNDCSFIAFADDLVVYFEASNLETACERMHVILSRLDTWCNSVGLPISFSKTKFMIFRKSGVPRMDLTNITVNNNVIEKVSSFKYLGLYLDEYLNYKCHFDQVYRRISVNAGLICKIRRNITPYVLMLLINAYINSIIDYSLIVWGATRQNDFDRLQRVTRNILANYYYPNTNKYKHKRFWSELTPGEATKARKECYKAFKSIDFSLLLEKHNLSTVAERFSFFSVWFIYKVRKYGCKISTLCEIFSPQINNCSMVTRNTNLCSVKNHNTSIYQNSFSYSACKLWNSLPREFCDIDDKSLNFRKSVNQWLIDKRS